MLVSENVLHAERYILAGDLIIGVAYGKLALCVLSNGAYHIILGLQVALWCLCISYLWPQRQNGWKARLLIA